MFKQPPFEIMCEDHVAGYTAHNVIDHDFLDIAYNSGLVFKWLIEELGERMDESGSLVKNRIWTARLLDQKNEYNQWV